jgi:benzoyl-CoA reductase/2-hydroxyglutaryl-CoA dehydratase subunit BcrC/BadD/HgdB
MNNDMLFDTSISMDAVKKWRQQGKKALGVICCHVPPEIFMAADILPVRMRATGCTGTSDADVWMSSFSCSFARGILQNWLDGTYELDGMVASDGCMMAARIHDNAAYINAKHGNGKFFMQIAAPRICAPRTIEYYKGELSDLIKKLEELTGNKVTEQRLRDAIAEYNEARVLIKQVYELRRAENPLITGEEALKITLAYAETPISEYIKHLKLFLEDVKNRKPIENARARLMLIGSALDDPEYIKIIEDKGGLVVNDLLCFGGRAFGDELIVDDNDILGSIARYYLSRLVCPRMIDNREYLHGLVISEAKEFGVQGIIYEKMQYCECWGGESVLLNEKLKNAGIPFLTLEREEQIVSAGQLAVRAEAFIEMIEGV